MTGAAFQARIHRSLGRIGSDSHVYVRQAARVHDAGAGTVVKVNTDTALRAAVTGYMDKDIDGSLVRASDKKVRISGKAAADAGLTLTEDDSLLIGGVEHEIVNLEIVAPSGVVEEYIAQVRK